MSRSSQDPAGAGEPGAGAPRAASEENEYGQLKEKVSRLSDMMELLLARSEEPGGVVANVAREGGESALGSQRAASHRSGELRGVPDESSRAIPVDVGPALGGHSGEARGLDPQGESTRIQRNGAFLDGYTPSQNKRVVPVAPKLDGESRGNGFHTWKNSLLQASKTLGLDGQFIGETERHAPVGNPNIGTGVLRQQGYNLTEIDRGLQAFSFISATIVREADKAIVNKCLTAKQVLIELEKMYDPESQGSKQALVVRLHNFRIPQGSHSNPIESLYALEQLYDRVREKGLHADQPFVLAHFLSALPPEYQQAKFALETSTSADRAEIIRMVSTVHASMTAGRKASKGPRKGEQAFFAGNNSGGGGARDGRRNGRSGGGRGGGNSKKKEGGNAKPDGAGGNGGGAGGDSTARGRCFRCGKRGHTKIACNVPESELPVKCDICMGLGHNSTDCLSKGGLLAFELPPEVPADVGSDAEQGAYVARDDPAGKWYLVGNGGVVGQAKQERFVADTAATSHMSHNADAFFNYTECDTRLHVASGETIPIVGHGDLRVGLRSEKGVTDILLKNVAHIPQLSHTLISMTTLGNEGHTYVGGCVGGANGLDLRLKGGDSVFFPNCGNLCVQSGFRKHADGREYACAVIAPGIAKATDAPHDINEYHSSHGHSHEVMLKETAKQQGVKLTGELNECLGCSMSKGLASPIRSKTSTRALLPPTDEGEDQHAGENEVEEDTSRRGGGGEGEPEGSIPDVTVTMSVPAAMPGTPQGRGREGTSDGSPRREGASGAPSTTPASMADVGGGGSDANYRSSSNSSSSSSSSAGDDVGSGSSDSSSNSDSSSSNTSSSSDSGSETDAPVLQGTEARRLARFGEPSELTSRRTRENPRQNPRYDAEALVAETEWARQSLVEERAEEAHIAREEADDLLEPDAPGSQDELDAPTPIGRRPNEVEAPPLNVTGVGRSVYRQGWEEAMRIEFEGHLETGTFSFADEIPGGRRPVTSKWCFSWKTNKEGKIEKFKARLVARGFSQIPNVDYFHSSSPCPSAASIKTVLAVANEKGLTLRHMDVKQAYTHAKLEELVWLKLPPGCGEKSHKIVKAERAIYGLKQSGRQWGYHAADTLVENGFEQCKADPCIFRKVVDEVVVMIIAIYVDDILVAGSDDACDELLVSLNKKFPTKDLGECVWFDGCGIERDLAAGTLKVVQTAYVDSIVSRFEVQSISPIPISPGADLGPKRDGESGGDWPVREAIGSMMWLSTFSRPDISFAVRAVARHAHAPTARHWKAIQQILSYLKGTRDLGITYKKGSGLGLAVFVDASYADTEDRRSVSGIATMVGGAVVSHGSKTQGIVSVSSTESEYIAAGEGVKEALFVRHVLSFVAPETSGGSIRVLEDNQGAMALVQNPLSSARSKHIDVRFHFIRELFRSGVISIDYVHTSEQHADLLTKALSRASMQYHRKALMNLPE